MKSSLNSGKSFENRLMVQEVDGSPSGFPRVLKFINGTITDNGDGSFSNASIGAYGHFSQDDVSTTITVSSANVDYIVTGSTAGNTKNMTFQNTKELKVLIAGVYLITWQISFKTAAGSNLDIEGAVGIDGTRQASTSAHRKIGAATDSGSMSGTGILTLAVNNLLQLLVRNETDTNDIIIEHCNLTAILIS